MTANMGFEFRFSGKSQATGRCAEDVRRILVVGDFSGHRSKGILASRRLIPVDVQGIDDCIRQMRPHLDITLYEGERIAMDFTELEDFHPDALFARLDVFTELRRLRANLENPNTFNTAAAELKKGVATSTQSKQRPIENRESGGLFESLLGEPVQTLRQPQSSQVRAQDIIQRIVGPNLKLGIDLDEQRQLLSAVDDSIAQTMRSILHHPEFQALESCWRGMHWLLSRIEDDADVQIVMLDASLNEVTDDLLLAAGIVENTALHGLINGSSGIPGAGRWSAFVGVYEFGNSAGGLKALEMFGAIGSEHGAVFFGGASPGLVESETLFTSVDSGNRYPISEDSLSAWRKLRSSRFAAYIALALPRFMLRMPYGKRSDPIETFQFEEFSSSPVHNNFLWGCAGLFCTVALIENWVKGGSTLAQLRVDDLPYYIPANAAEEGMQACAENYLTEMQGRQISESGLIPLLSIRNRNQIILPWLISVAIENKVLDL